MSSGTAELLTFGGSDACCRCISRGASCFEKVSSRGRGRYRRRFLNACKRRLASATRGPRTGMLGLERRNAVIWNVQRPNNERFLRKEAQRT